MSLKLRIALLAVPLLFAFAPKASATTFIFDQDNLGGNLAVGRHKNIRATFDNNTDLLTWESTFTRNSGRLADGAWVVLNGGGNPRSDVHEYPIFYLDGLQKRVSIYSYDGTVSARSYQSSTFLGTAPLQVSDSGDDRTFSFAYDTTDINGRTDLGDNWKGAIFGDDIGLWFHGVDELTTAYNADNSLKEFSFKRQGWYDQGNHDTTRVPEPGTVAALGAVAVAATAGLRKRAS